MNRILLIGCESPTGHSLSRTLGGLGFGVDTASDGRTGLGLARKRRYSHVLIDDEQTHGDSLTLFHQMQQFQQGAIGVLVTAVANLDSVYAAVEAGMRRVLAKPVDYDQLLPLLDPSLAKTQCRFSEPEIAALSTAKIHESLSRADLVDVIRSVDYPFAGKHRLAHFDRDTLERVVHLVCRWCRQRQQRENARGVR